MFCPKCGAKLDENATECSLCGYHIEDGDKGINSGQGRSLTCPVCGSALRAEDRVCPLCGATIETKVEEAAPSAVSESSPAAESEPAPSPVSEAEPSPDKGGKVETTQEPQPEKQQKREEKEEKEEKERASRPRRRAWVIVLIIIIIVVVVFLALYFTGVISFGDRENSRTSTTESTAVAEGKGSANGEEEANVAPDTSYVGYWNIGGSTDEELTISSVTDSTVGFSLWWRNLFRVDNATAYINEENIATFSCVDGDMKMSGNLTFYVDSIVVQITESNIDYIDTGTMVFDVKHLEAWNAVENANASTSSSSSSDSSSTSDQNSGSTSNQNTSIASSGSNSTPSSYYYSGDYVLPNSSSQLLTYADIQGLTSDELRLARNEIYARHGRKFDDNALQSYFNSKSWYTGTIDPDDFSQDMLSSIERSNVSFIESYE